MRLFYFLCVVVAINEFQLFWSNGAYTRIISRVCKKWEPCIKMLAFYTYVDFPLTREKIFTVKINLLSARGERRCLSSSCWYFRDNAVHCIGGNRNCWLLYRIGFVNWLLSVGMVDGCHLSHCASSYRYLSSSPSFLPIRSIGGGSGLVSRQSCFLFYCLWSSDLVPLVNSLMGRV